MGRSYRTPGIDFLALATICNDMLLEKHLDFGHPSFAIWLLRRAAVLYKNQLHHTARDNCITAAQPIATHITGPNCVELETTVLYKDQHPFLLVTRTRGPFFHRLTSPSASDKIFDWPS